METLTKVFGKQCPQFYIVLGASLTTILVFMKLAHLHCKCCKRNGKMVLYQIIHAVIMVMLMIGTGFCKWPWNWLSWLIAISSMLAIIGNVLLLLTPGESLKKAMNIMDDTLCDN